MYNKQPMSTFERRQRKNQPELGSQDTSKGHEDARRSSLREKAVRFLAGTALASIAASGAATAIDGGGIKTEIGGHPAETKTTTKTIPASETPGAIAEQTLKGTSAKIDQNSEYSEDGKAVDLSDQQKEQISTFLANLESQQKNLEEDGKKPENTTVTVIGSASDEDLDNPNGDLGQSSSMNQVLATERAQLIADELKRQAEEKGISLEVVGVDGSERVLSDSQIKEVEDIANKYGVSTHELLIAYNFDTGAVPMDDQEKSKLVQLFNDNRSTNIDTTITIKDTPVELGVCDKVVIVNPEQKVDVTKDIPKEDPLSIRIFPIPAYIPRGGRKKKGESDSKPENQSNDNETSADVQNGSGELVAQKDQPVNSEPLRGEIVEDPDPGSEVAGLITAVEVPVLDEDPDAPDDKPAAPEKSDSARTLGSSETAKTIGTPHRKARSVRQGEVYIDSERIGFIGGIVGKTAAVAAALALVPIPWFTKAETQNQPPEDDKCTSYSIEQGTIREAHLTTLGLAAYSWITGNKLPQVIDRYVSESPKVTEINKPHTKYEVDQNGNILKTENVPEQSTTKKVRPDISRG